jgi:Cd2+/Zn2+-exporting ATPase/Cu+-exporting ATPase
MSSLSPREMHIADVHEEGSIEAEAEEHGVSRSDALRIALVAAAAAATWLGLAPRLNGIEVVALLAATLGAYPIYHEAYSALRERRMTMELSMSIALLAAAAIGEFMTASVIAAFVLAAEAIEGLTVGRGRNALRDLVGLMPCVAVVRRDGTDHEVPAEEVVVGDTVVLKPGGRVPVDGVVLSGHSFLDQSTITGESMPVEKQAGNDVFAGTINRSGALLIRATGVGRETAFGRIIDAVERAERSRAPVQKIADRLAGYLVYFALGSAAITFVVTRDPVTTISVVIVAGACGVAAGTPLAILGGIGRAARGGAIIKGGRYLEMLGQIDTVVLDKTGTVTFGVPEVVDVLPATGVSPRELLRIVASAESRSEHPLARAIIDRARTERLQFAEPHEFRYEPGLGISCVIDDAEVLVGNRKLLHGRGVDLSAAPERGPELSEVLVARNGELMGSLHIADVLRPEAVDAVRALRKLGLHTILLTGDAAAIGAAVGHRLGVDEASSELLPDQKLDRIRELLAQRRVVAMVGDGVNDAPALTAASVGVAMGSGTDVAMESADVVLLGNDLMRLVETLRTARACRSIIWQNFAGTIAVDLVGIGLAAVGLLDPLLAATIHVMSELTFILNSTRLLAPPPESVRIERGPSPDRGAAAPVIS